MSSFAKDAAMWDSNVFGSTSGQPSGGFLDNTHNFPSPSKAPEDKRRTDRITNIVPCTIAKILQVPETEEHVKIGMLSAHIVTVVGCVIAVDRQSAKITYTIDDASGKAIQAQLWIGDESTNEATSIAEKSYVRVTGALRIMRGSRHIIVFKIRPVTDLNELTMHLLEVIHTSMLATIMSKQSSASNLATLAGNVSSSNVTDAAASFAGNQMASAPSSILPSSAFASYGLNKAQQMVLQTIISCDDEQGANIHNIIDQLKSLNRKTVTDAVEFLSNEGHIYSTIDDDHYKSTDSG